MNCPFCAAERGSLITIAMHIEADHPGRQILVTASTAELCVRLPVVECDIDSVYRTRPDLIKPRSAP